MGGFWICRGEKCLRRGGQNGRKKEDAIPDVMTEQTRAGVVEEQILGPAWPAGPAEEQREERVVIYMVGDMGVVVLAARTLRGEEEAVEGALLIIVVWVVL
jgi:hypothetical protein